MSLGSRLLGSTDDEPGVIHHPRVYEFIADVSFLGARRRIWGELAAACGARPGDDVIDIGCGTGYFTRAVAPAVLPGGSVAGIDPSARLLEYAAARSPRHVHYTRCGAEQLPCADSSVDLAVSSLAFHHIPGEVWTSAMAEIVRVLRPGGRLFIADFRAPSVRPWMGRILALTGAEHMLHDDRDALAEVITAAGLTLTGTGIHPRMHHIAARKPDQDSAHQR